MESSDDPDMSPVVSSEDGVVNGGSNDSVTDAPPVSSHQDPDDTSTVETPMTPPVETPVVTPPVVATPPDTVTPEPAAHYTAFHSVVYLGTATILQLGEAEIEGNIATLNQAAKAVIPVVFKIPTNSTGHVMVVDAGREPMITYPVRQILQCKRGRMGTNEENCFAFLVGASRGTSSPQEDSRYQCYVFRCEFSDACGRVLQCFTKCFKQPEPPVTERDPILHFEAVLDILEQDNKGTFCQVPREKLIFRLRQNAVKKVTLSLRRTTKSQLTIEKFIGILVAPLRNASDGDLTVITSSPDDGFEVEEGQYVFSGILDPVQSSHLTILNEVTEKNRTVFLSFAVDFVISQVQVPVRIRLEASAKVIPAELNDRWNLANILNRQTGGIEEQFSVLVKPSGRQSTQYKFEIREVLQQKFGRTLPPLEDSDSDEDRTISGGGDVSKEIATAQDEDLVERWTKLLQAWGSERSRSPALRALCAQGVPEALRVRVWELLTSSHPCTDSQRRDGDSLRAEYRDLVNADSSYDSQIDRDLNRTFPANDFFNGGDGPDFLRRICHAYAVKDRELGYCQGLSFIAAVFILHMPEEQAFVALVQTMYHYDARALFLADFNRLHLLLYQMDCLLKRQNPEVHDHLKRLGVEPHMFASQWFLTLFTAKFPLPVVYRIMDLFLHDGTAVLLSVAVAMLMLARVEILSRDFEGVMKYVRGGLPRRFRVSKSCDELINTAKSIKVSAGHLSKWETSFWQDNQELQLASLREVNQKQRGLITSLEFERDLRDGELEMRTLQLQENQQKLRERLDEAAKKNGSLRDVNSQLEDQVEALMNSGRLMSGQLRTAEGKAEKMEAIVGEYKTICNRQSDELDRLRELVASCPECSKQDLTSPLSRSASANSYSASERDLELELARAKSELAETRCQLELLQDEGRIAQKPPPNSSSGGKWFSNLAFPSSS